MELSPQRIKKKVETAKQTLRTTLEKIEFVLKVLHMNKTPLEIVERSETYLPRSSVGGWPSAKG
jgi:hypothetical protein